MDGIIVDHNTGAAYFSAAYAGELLARIRALEAELAILCEHLRNAERAQAVKFPPITGGSDAIL